MHPYRIIEAGKPVHDSDKLLIMLHGRGSTADDILSIAPELQVKEYAILAPQARNNSWYPYSFLLPVDKNEPWLSSAIQMLDELITDSNYRGINTENIFLLGFSQGACLALEYAAQRVREYGGIIAFSGGLIGDKIYNQKYKGNLQGTPVFIGSGNHDPHIPLVRIYETSDIMQQLNAKVILKVYDNIGHTISHDEIQTVNKLIFK